MSKMHNIIPSTPLSGFNALSPVFSPFQSTSKLSYFRDPQEKLTPLKQSVEVPENVSTDTKNERYTSEEQNVRFSRFSAWHLTHMAENKEVQRSTEQNRAILDVFQQESNLTERHEKSNQLTPGTAYKSTGCTEKDFYGFNSPGHNAKAPKKQKIIKPKQTGLRKLSGKAFKIVKELGEATYKDVASKLIESIINDESSFDDEKEQNNIKRRVYDALNVLIAMEILKKSGKNISYGHDPKDRTQGSRRQFLIGILAQKQQQIKIKKEKKQHLIRQRKALEYLASRNRNLGERQDCIDIPMMCLSASSITKLKVSPDCFQAEGSKKFKVFEGLESVASLFPQKLK